MRIGLWSDSHNFPSLPLMKISAYHKSIGDHIEKLNHIAHYDKVYASKVFSFTHDVDDLAMVYADEIQKGGSGYCISLVNGREVFDAKKNTPLPKEIESMFPDYALFPEYDYALGFLTRGCPRGCGFCIVGKKEGCKSVQVADIGDFWNGQKQIMLLDPNLLACPDHERLLMQLAETNALVDFSQGLDIRLITKQNIELIKQVRIKRIHFAWDNPKQDLTRHFQKFMEYAKLTEPQVYILTNYDSTMEEDEYRVNTLRDLGYLPYVMIYDKEHCDREHRRFQRWVNSRQIFRNIKTFAEYRG